MMENKTKIDLKNKSVFITGVTFRLLVCVSLRYMALLVAQIWRTLALRISC